ncbi:MAG: hypothetical protein ABWZ40_03085 [Caulobacterales bacterium]
MSIVSSRTRARGQDHFEPDAALDPLEQRALRGHLEQIDFTSFAANKEVIGAALGHTDISKFQRLAVAAANARAHWVSASLDMASAGHALDAKQVAQLSALRAAYDELTEAYEGLRRMVERGYLTYQRKG